MTAISSEDLVAHIAAHAGITSELAAMLAADVLAEIASHLSTASRELVASEIPDPLADALRRGGSSAPPIEERILAPGVTLGRAHELVSSVCLVLAEELSDEAIAALRAALPPALARLFAAPTPEIARRSERRRAPSMASGRPGSEHPISEAHADLAQPGSVADPNPHASSKLSSSAGTTQERLHETLAEGEAGTDLPIADG